jgi:hypothetical protein
VSRQISTMITITIIRARDGSSSKFNKNSRRHKSKCSRFWRSKNANICSTNSIIHTIDVQRMHLSTQQLTAQLVQGDIYIHILFLNIMSLFFLLNTHCQTIIYPYACMIIQWKGICLTVAGICKNLDLEKS